MKCNYQCGNRRKTSAEAVAYAVKRKDKEVNVMWNDMSSCI